MLIKRPANHRKVIVVVSESQNNGSEVNLGHTLRTAQLNDIMRAPRIKLTPADIAALDAASEFAHPARS